MPKKTQRKRRKNSGIEIPLGAAIYGTVTASTVTGIQTVYVHGDGGRMTSLVARKGAEEVILPSATIVGLSAGTWHIAWDGTQYVAKPTLKSIQEANHLTLIGSVKIPPSWEEILEAIVVSLSDGGTAAAQPANAQQTPKPETSKAAGIEERQTLWDAYRRAFPHPYMIDVCWAADQRRREWDRWLNGEKKGGSKPDRMFRSVLTSGKDARTLRTEPRPKEWK